MNIAGILSCYGIEPYAEEVAICCPFHNDHTPSLSMNTESGLWYCFVCGFGGRLVDYIAQIEGLDRFFTRLHLAHLSRKLLEEGITIHTKSHGFEIEEKQMRRESIQKAYAFYKSLPLPNWQETEACYLFDRGFSSASCEKMGARLNPGSPYPIVLPLLENGKFRGIIMRRVDEQKHRKYLYNSGFARSRVLEGTYKEGRPVLVVEGKMDKEKALQFGVKRVVALLGWKASLHQIKKLALCSALLWATDNDERGEEGYHFICEQMRPFQVPVYRFAFPPDKKDVCDLTRSEFWRGFRNIPKNALYTQNEKRNILLIAR